MASWQGQAHDINSNNVHAALVELRELAKLQKGRAGSTSPQAEVSGASGARTKEYVAPTVAILKPPMDAAQDDFPNQQLPIYRGSILSRSLRIVIHGSIAFVIVSAAFAWRASDDNTKETMKAWASSLSGLSPLPGANSHDAESSPNATATPVELNSNHSDQDAAQNSATMPAAPVVPSAAAPAEVSPELQQRLTTISGDLAVVQQTLAELVAAQRNMVREIAALQAAQQAVSQKTSPISPSRAARRKNETTELRSETVVERNSGPATLSPPQPPLELH
jgi:hypothetical protein